MSEPRGTPDVALSEQLLADLRGVQTGWHPVTSDTSPTGNEAYMRTATAAAETDEELAWRGVKVFVDDYWAASKQARIDFPLGPARSAEWNRMRAAVKQTLTDMGLPYVPALPPTAHKAREAAFAAFMAYLATNPVRRVHSPRRRRLHKPLLLLMCFGRCAHRESRMVRFAAIEGELSELLREFDRPGSSASEPFWRLQNDGQLWVIEGDSLDDLKSSADAPSGSQLRDHNVLGGLRKSYFDALSVDQRLLSAAVEVVITTFLPEVIWEEIDDRFGFALRRPQASHANTEAAVTVDRALDESKRAFQWAQRNIAAGQARDEAFAIQASILIQRLEALHVLKDGAVSISTDEIEPSRYDDLVNFSRMGAKNITNAVRRHGWSNADALGQYVQIFPETVRGGAAD